MDSASEVEIKWLKPPPSRTQHNFCVSKLTASLPSHSEMSQLMRLWYLPHRRPAQAQASLRICTVLPEPSLFAHMKYGSRQNQASIPTGWLLMRVWKMSLWRKKSTIIDGPIGLFYRRQDFTIFNFHLAKLSQSSYMYMFWFKLKKKKK